MAALLEPWWVTLKRAGQREFFRRDRRGHPARCRAYRRGAGVLTTAFGQTTPPKGKYRWCVAASLFRIWPVGAADRPGRAGDVERGEGLTLRVRIHRNGAAGGKGELRKRRTYATRHSGQSSLTTGLCGAAAAGAASLALGASEKSTAEAEAPNASRPRFGTACGSLPVPRASTTRNSPWAIIVAARG